MAKIGALPATAIIDAFRGKLDFYKWCDLTIVRKWPRSPGRKRNPAVVAAQGPFIYINKLAGSLNEEVINSYKVIATKGGLSWKDYLTRWYINGTIQLRTTPDTGYKYDEGWPYMKLVLLDTELNIFNKAAWGANIAWTDIDLSPHVSPDATFAYLRVKMQHNGAIINATASLFVRGKGTTIAQAAVQDYMVDARGLVKMNDVYITLDSAQTMQYKFDKGDGANDFYLDIWLMGYIEQV